jgi:NitT/TauT family transport system permease protein
MNALFSVTKSASVARRPKPVLSEPLSADREQREQRERLRQASLRRVQTTQRFLSLLLPLGLGCALFVIWYASAAAGKINSLILPAPADVFVSLVDGLRSGLYWTHVWITIQESLSGFLLATLIALPLGYGVAKSRLLASVLQPYLAAGQAIPAIVMAPFLTIWLGQGRSILPVVVVCMLVVLFPLVMNTILGVRTIDPSLQDAARVEGARGWTLLRHIEFPLALPAILSAVRTCLTLSITGAVVGEFVCSPDRGLGGLVQIALNQFNTTFMFATVIVLALLAAFYYSATWLLVKLAESIY